jgi:hypothetical protein
MPGVTVLSEIHPRGAEAALQFDPLFQAQYWFKLLTDAEARALRARGDFAATVGALAARAAARGEALVVRDWSYLDYMGRPFVEAPSGRSALVEALAGSCRLVRTTTVRHPAAQWLSWHRFAPDSGLSLADHMAGVRRFAEEAAAVGFLRYEDFTANPDHVLAELAWRLELRFDAGWAYRWFFYRSVTGDLDGLDRHRIERAAPPRVPPALAEALAASADYQRALELLGYDDAQVDDGAAAAAGPGVVARH